ncbi:hypothetical protein JHL17_09545 [Azospirillum sp. YIM B02556]|uniref:Uncharacterized protein n=1 Tax=Azospirillum endophyticum TaxID=2800326 RepID=A0ABS1F2N0_9PROT|nr:hypothetical protein [Azospirillum endophyticum]MBK1837658.1 hypothetical protein [Azospirillum endophyticum]
MPPFHPRFHPGPSSGRLDSFSERGARELARRIRAAWARLGWDVEVRVERIASEELDDGRSIAHFIVRSDLINGLPHRRLDQRRAPHPQQDAREAAARPLPRAA